MNKRVTKEIQQRWNDRIAWIQSAKFSIAETQEVRMLRKTRARSDFDFFVRYYFPHLANKPCAKFHIDAAKYLLKHKQTRALFEWARGHAKSSHLSLLIPLWLKIQAPRELNVMVLVSKSQDAAIRLLSDLQAELQYNEIFINDFGRQVMEGSWADGEFRTMDGCLFVAIGRGQSPRGLKDRGKRPDYIVIDDIDDDEMIRNPSRVSYILDWCLSALFGTMEGGRGRFVMVGNRIGKDSVLSRFSNSANLYHTKVNMLDKEGKPSWHENYTLDEVKKIREFIGERRFEKEYMNNPVNEGTIFLQKQIRFGKIHDLKEYKSLICYTDPSFKDSNTADYKATMLVGKSKTGEYHLIKAFSDQTSVAQMVRWHYELDAYINGRVPVLYFMESNFLQELLLDEFRKTGEFIGHQIPVRGDARKKPDKFARIESMQPLFERKLFLINEREKDSNGVRVLIEQLLMFEKGSKTHDDAPDALEGAIFLLNQRTRSAGSGYRIGKIESRKY
jgi:predicted phage terminase large subunit-like protein